MTMKRMKYDTEAYINCEYLPWARATEVTIHRHCPHSRRSLALRVPDTDYPPNLSQDEVDALCRTSAIAAWNALYENIPVRLTSGQRLVWCWLGFKEHVRQFIYNTLILLIRMMEETK